MHVAYLLDFVEQKSIHDLSCSIRETSQGTPTMSIHPKLPSLVRRSCIAPIEQCRFHIELKMDVGRDEKRDED